MKKTIYIEGLGYRNPISDREQIIWFLQQNAALKPKAHATRYWLDLKEQLKNRLLEMEAYELYAVIIEKATDAKEKKRMLARKKAKEKAQKELGATNKYIEQWQLKRDLINKISLN